MHVFGIALITLLSFIGLVALITGFIVGETFFIVIGLLLFIMALIYAELSGDFPLGDSRQPTYKSLRPFDLVS